MPQHRVPACSGFGISGKAVGIDLVSLDIGINTGAVIACKSVMINPTKRLREE